MKEVIRIGNSSGFWGDEPLAMKRQIEKGNLDYLVADYLAEVSMSILHKQMQRKPDLGYVPDFIEHMRLTGELFHHHFPKIITNAGGKNPIACAKAVQSFLDEIGIVKKVMAVVGDDLMSDIDSLEKTNEFQNLETGESFKNVKEKLAVANVYTSSEGIVKALGYGADIVITGRASDSALAIGPLVYEFGWAAEDWDLLASGMVAGHVLECGSQATGGNFTDWKTVEKWNEMGYPVVEVQPNGDFMVTKPEGTGGLVNQWTVKEQLVYEIADPERYLGPDVIADLTHLSVKDTAQSQINIKGVKGKPAPDTWKVSMAYLDGYKAIGHVVIGGKDASEKAQLIRDVFWNRSNVDYDKTNTNLIGTNALGEGLASSDGKEILLQFVAFDQDRSKLELFAKEVAGLILAGPQGMAAYGGRPRIQEVVSYWPTLVNRKDLSFEIYEVTTDTDKIVEQFSPQTVEVASQNLVVNQNIPSPQLHILEPIDDSEQVEMVDLCLARSGDKGNGANIGILARNELIYSFLKENLTPNILKGWFGDLCQGEILRFELHNIQALNFHLKDVLDGGGTKSGRLDPQGKMLASLLLAQKIYVPKLIINTLKKQH